MQKDFHFYAIAVLAKFAGFNPQDALTIAFASQYVDDADENKPFWIGKRRFDPTRTTYMGINSFDWRVQRDIYLAFHFLPPSATNYIVKPNPRFVQDMIKQAETEIMYTAYLIRLGIALHTYADTWAHQGFTGRREKANDVTNIQIYEKKWTHPIMDNIKWDFAPMIGHAEAGHYPDIPHYFWKYTAPGQKGKVYKRNNAVIFLEAAKSIHSILTGARKDPGSNRKPWVQVEEKIATLFQTSGTLEQRCQNWQQLFSQYFPYGEYTYDSEKWRREALKPSNDREISWTNFSERDFDKLRFKENPKFQITKFALFHKMALKQRHYVIQKILW